MHTARGYELRVAMIQAQALIKEDAHRTRV